RVRSRLHLGRPGPDARAPTAPEPAGGACAGAAFTGVYRSASGTDAHPTHAPIPYRHVYPHHRQQELLFLVVAPVASPARGRYCVPGTETGPFHARIRATPEHADARRPGAGTAGWRIRRLGFSGHLRICGGTTPPRRPVAGRAARPGARPLAG